MVSDVTPRTGAAAPVAASPRSLAWPRPSTLAWVAVPAAIALGSAYFVLITWMAFTRHATFNSGRLDLEIYSQVVWNTAHGRPFETTLLKTNLSHLAEHIALVLVPLSWLYRVFPDPRLLIGIQQLALALLGWPIFQWASRALDSRAQALIVLACFYASPALASIALDDFHAVPLTALPLAVGFSLVLAGRHRVGAGVALAALPMEEESAIALIGLGAFLVYRRQRGLGALVAGLAALWLLVAAFVVMPRFHDPRTLGLVGGNRTLEHFSEALQDPSVVVRRVFGQRGVDAATWAILPTAGLAALAADTLLVAAPSLLALLLQDREDTFARHWAAPLVVTLWLATIAGLARLPIGMARWVGLGLLVVGTGVAFRLMSPLPGGGGFDPTVLRFDEREALLERAVARVPPQATVVASANAIAHLANRPEAYVFPIDSHYAEELGWRRKRPDFILLDLNDELTSRAAASERLNPLNADRPYHVWSSGHKVLVLSNQVAAPAVPLEARYGDRLLLKGYDLLPTSNGPKLVLHWERYGELRGRYDRDLTLFDGRGNRLLYEEDMTLSQVYGSNKWRPGQTILDEISLPGVLGPVRARVAWVAQERRRPFLLQDGSEAFEFVFDLER